MIQRLNLALRRVRGGVHRVHYLAHQLGIDRHDLHDLSRSRVGIPESTQGFEDSLPESRNLDIPEELANAVLDVRRRPSGIRINERRRCRNNEAALSGHRSWCRLTAVQRRSWPLDDLNNRPARCDDSPFASASALSGRRLGFRSRFGLRWWNNWLCPSVPMGRFPNRQGWVGLGVLSIRLLVLSS